MAHQTTLQQPDPDAMRRSYEDLLERAGRHRMGPDGEGAIEMLAIACWPSQSDVAKLIHEVLRSRQALAEKDRELERARALLDRLEQIARA